MTNLLPYVVFALQDASIYAIAASGLVLTYTTSGIFNFAHGAIAMLSAFLYWELRYNRGLPAPVAIVIVLVGFGPVLGLLIDKVVMRGLATASTITKIVVSVGLLYFFISVAAVIWPQNKSYVLPRFFEGEKLDLGTVVSIPYHSLVVFGLACLVALGLWFLLNRTRLGVAMRAVVDDRDLSRLNGIDPDRTSGAAWALGCSLAALAGICISPILAQLDVVSLTLLVVNAYAAAMVGRLRSLPLTFLGALILGVLINATTYITDTYPANTTWLLDLRNSGALPIIMLFVVLVVIPQERASLTVHRDRNRIPRPSLAQTLLGSAAVVAIAGVLAATLPDDKLLQVGKGLGLAIVMLSLVPLIGYAGQISLAQLAFGGVGAVVMWRFGGDGSWLVLILSVVVAGVVGAVIALPALRLRGLYLALITMAFAVIFERRFLGGLREWRSGTDKIAEVPRLAGFHGDRANFMLMAVMFCAVAVLVAAIRRGPFGRRLQAMKDSPAACATLGLDLTTTKLQVFALGAAIAGLGGVLYAGWRSDLGVSQVDFSLMDGALAGLPMLLLAVIGGITSVAGPLLGAMLLVGMPMIAQAVPALKNVMALLPGFAGITLARNPEGVAAQVGDRITGLDTGAGPEVGTAPAPVGPRRSPERMGLDGGYTPAEVTHLDDVLGLSWYGCNENGAGATPVAAGQGEAGA